MSLKSALEFLHWLRVHRDEADPVADDGDLDSFVGLAEGRGLQLTVNDLRSAHAHDWALRWLASGLGNGCGAGKREASSSASTR